LYLPVPTISRERKVRPATVQVSSCRRAILSPPPTKWTISSTSPSASGDVASVERGTISPLRSTATFDARNGQHGFFHAMPDGQRQGHQDNAEAADRQRPAPAMPCDADAQGDGADRNRQHQPDPMDFRRQQRLPADSQARHDHDRQQAVQCTQAGQHDARPVKPVTNRKKGCAHGQGDM
jgi:hypothetical protein